MCELFFQQIIKQSANVKQIEGKIKVCIETICLKVKFRQKVIISDIFIFVIKCKILLYEFKKV